MMPLSDAQTSAVMHGMAKQPATWEPVELPTGRFELPTWLHACHVDLNLQYANAPDVRLQTFGDPWPENEPKLYEDEGNGAWTARSADGYLLTRHHHDSHLYQVIAWRVVNSDGIVTRRNPHGWSIADPTQKMTQAQAAVAAAEDHLRLCERLKTDGASDFRIEYTDVWTTARSSGYGGRHFEIMLKDGRTVVLRGPWHGGAPVGWTEAFVINMNDDWNRRPTVVGGKTYRWYQKGGTFGYFFSNELVLKAVARYQAHLRAAMVYPGYGHARIEFYDPNWGAPKGFAEARLPGWGPAK